MLLPKLIFLQEIWAPYCQEFALNQIYPDYSILIATPDMFTPPEDLLGRTDHTWHGAAIMWHTSLDANVRCLKTTNHRFAGLRINTKGQQFLAVSVYFPTAGKDEEYLECVSDLTNFVLVHKKENDVVLIGTDSNCSEKSSKRRVLAFQSLLQDLNLVKTSTSNPTFHHHNGTSESNIDFFLISEEYSAKLTNPTALCTLNTPDNLSAHDPVKALLQIPDTATNPPGADYSDNYTDFNQQKVIWETDKLEKYQHIAAMALTEYDTMFPLPEHIPLKCELFSNLLVRSAEISMPTKLAGKKAKKKNKTSPLLHRAWSEMRRKFNAWKCGGKCKDAGDISFHEYKQARGVFQQRNRQESTLNYIRNNNTIMSADHRNKKQFFKLIKNLRPGRQSLAPATLHNPAATFYGADTLEGFTVDAEILGQAVGESPEYDNEFYRLCKLDNHYIFEFKGKEAIKIPDMTMEDLENILTKDMKLRKACDIYKLTVEHLRYAGYEAKLVILGLLNDIIHNIYYLTCPQIKKGLSSNAYKGKKKPVADSNSYRRITVTPQIGGILDRFIDPIAESIFLKVQSPDQLGFTKHISYLMAAVERGECQRHALDTKQTYFGVSVDGKAAFPSVDRDIQVRELYASCETGDHLRYSNNTYQHTVSHVKQDGKLGRQFTEFKGSRQGHKRAAGHFKSYINPCLTAASSSELGFWIGPICVSCVCVADDTYILSSNPRKLQGLINIVGHYGRRYRVIFGADKTKVTITGSKHDMNYFQDINIWSLDGEPLVVTEDNDHLGLVVSGIDEEIKNVDKNVDSARQTLFNLLGSIFSFKCKLSQTVLYHVWSIFVNPILRSGLAALPIRPTVMKTVAGFHHKVLRGILKFSPVSPIAPLYFLLGELPMEAAIHLDTLTLFWNIWANTQTKVSEIVKYLLMMTSSSSLTWTAHLRLLFQLYDLPDPLALMSSNPWPKETWKLTTKTAVTVYHERKWRELAAGNSKLSFFNVQTLGLSGRPHSVLSNILTTQEVPRSRVHLKMLAGDYPCHAYLGSDQAKDDTCPLCQSLFPDQPAPIEDMVHLLTRCRATTDTRGRFTPELLNKISKFFPNNPIVDLPNQTHLTQLILDPTSLNLPPTIRISPGHPALPQILTTCRSLCFAVHKERTKQLKDLGQRSLT